MENKIYIYLSIYCCSCFTVGPYVAAPVFSKTLKSVDVPEGVALVLECHVSGTPLPEISWYQDRNQLGDELVLGDNAGKSSVKIGSLQLEHTGEYLCRAANVAGEAWTSASIRVVRKCQLTTRLSFSCTVDMWYVKKLQCHMDVKADSVYSNKFQSNSMNNKHVKLNVCVVMELWSQPVLSDVDLLMLMLMLMLMRELRLWIVGLDSAI